MSSNKRKVRCFAERRGQQWQAFCIELNLAAQADTLKEVRQKLHRIIHSYVDLAMEQNDPDHQRDMLYRPAPISIQLRYWYVRSAIEASKLYCKFRDLLDHRTHQKRSEREHGRRSYAFHDHAAFC